MDAPALKVSLIVSLVLLIAIKLFYVVMNQYMELMEWFFKSGFYLEYLSRILGIYLGLAFLVYAYRKNYSAVFYGLLAIYGLAVLQYLSYSFASPTLFAASGINIGVVIGIVHALTILLSPARSNRYLAVYAIVMLITTIAAGNMIRMELYWLMQIFQLVTTFIPVIFIFLVVHEFKNSTVKSADDLVDQN